METTDVVRPLAEGSGLLEGVTVLDLTHVLAGPYASMLLGDLGADVLKIEPPHGEDTRRVPPQHEGSSAAFRMVNRNKRSVPLDLTDERGANVFRKLVRTADVVLENYSPGTMQRLGLGWETLSALNPRLVMVSISGFGQTGPYAARKGLDLIAQAMSGMMSVTGETDGPPLKCGIPVLDIGAGLHAVVAILAALRHRDRHGAGQYVETSLFEVGASFAVWQAAEHWATGRIPQRWGSAHPLMSPYEAFATRDGHIVLAGWSDRHWRTVCEALGVPELIDDPRFATPADRVANRPALRTLLEAQLVRSDSAHWVERLAADGIPAGPIQDFAQVFSDPHLIERGLIRRDERDSLPVLGHPVRYGASPWQLRAHAPRLGEHTREVLGRLGLDRAEIDALIAADVTAEPAVIPHRSVYP